MRNRKGCGCGCSIFLVFLLLIGSISGGYWAWQQSQQGSCQGTSSGGNYNVGGNTSTGNDKQLAQAAYNTFTKLGWTPEAACAGLGNLQWESGGHFDVHAKEGGGGGGYGLPQFTGSTLAQARQIASQQHFNFDTIEGQCETLVYSIEHGGQWMNKDGTSYQQFKTSKDIAKAARAFCTDYERPKVGMEHYEQRVQDAQQWAAAFCKGDNDKITQQQNTDFAANNANGASPNSNGSCDVGGDSGTAGAGGDILQTAKGWMGWFHYGEVHPSPTLGKDLKNPNKNGITDCSGFVWLVLNKCGYKVPANMGWFTGSMAADAKGPHKWLKQIPADKAKAGDIVIVNDGGGAGGMGHTAILMQDWHGNSTMIINEGGCGGSGGVNTSTFQQAFLSLLSGGDITFAEPIK